MIEGLLNLATKLYSFKIVMCMKRLKKKIGQNQPFPRYDVQTKHDINNNNISESQIYRISDRLQKQSLQKQIKPVNGVC